MFALSLCCVFPGLLGQCILMKTTRSKISLGPRDPKGIGRVQNEDQELGKSIKVPVALCPFRWTREKRTLEKRLGTLRSNDADGNQNGKKQQFLLAKQQLCTCTTLFCTFLCPFMHDYDVNMTNFLFYGGRKQATTKFYFSFCTWIWYLGIQLQEGSPTFDKGSGQE